MKVALAIERMDPLRGGRETYTARLAEELARRGHAVTILCQQRSWEPSREGIGFVEFGRTGLTRRRKLERFVADVERQATRAEYDVVHAMLPVPAADVYHPHGGAVPASVEASLGRRPAVVRPVARRLKRLNAARRLSAALERRIVEDGRALCVCVSPLVAGQFRRHYGVEAPLRVVFNGVDVPDAEGEERADRRQRIRYKLGQEPGDVVFLTVATNFPLKGVAECIAAFARYFHGRPRGCCDRLVVVGRENPEAYSRYAGMRDVGRSVVFVPPTKDVFDWYAAADCFVLLTWYDPCSLTVLEATRWGIPSITTEHNGAADVLRDGGGIVLAGPRDLAGATAAMETMADPDSRAAAAAACRKWAGYLTMERHVDELMGVYEEARRRR